MKTIVTKKDDLLRKLKYGVCAFALAGMVMMATPVAGYGDEIKPVEQAEVQIEKDAQEQTAEKRQKIVSEALSALQETSHALKALDEGRNEDALASLEKATGKLEIVLAREPRLAFAPVSAVHSTQDIVTNVEGAKRMVKEAEDLLEDGYVQDARLLLNTMVSETVITVTGLPMGTYPAAIKQAAAFIDEGQTEAAKTVLQTALNTLAINVTVIPIPVASAERLLRQAETLSEKKERTEKENKRLSGLLDAAETEIKFAQVLGYGGKKDFEGFYKEIETIREKTAEGKSGSGFFKKIKGFMTSMTDDSQPEEGVTN
jgi:hypothetical protein